MPMEDIARAWAGPLGLAVATMLIAVLVYRVGHKVVARLTLHSRALRAMADRMHGPLQLLLPLAALALVLDGAPTRCLA